MSCPLAHGRGTVMSASTARPGDKGRSDGRRPQGTLQMHPSSGHGGIADHGHDPGIALPCLASALKSGAWHATGGQAFQEGPLKPSASRPLFSPRPVRPGASVRPDWALSAAHGQTRRRLVRKPGQKKRRRGLREAPSPSTAGDEPGNIRGHEIFPGPAHPVVTNRGEGRLYRKVPWTFRRAKRLGNRRPARTGSPGRTAGRIW